MYNTWVQHTTTVKGYKMTYTQTDVNNVFKAATNVFTWWGKLKKHEQGTFTVFMCYPEMTTIDQVCNTLDTLQQTGATGLYDALYDHLNKVGEARFVQDSINVFTTLALPLYPNKWLSERYNVKHGV